METSFVSDALGELIGFFFYTNLILLPFIVLAAIFLLFCISSAPLAGLICAVLAHRREKSVWRYGLGGTACAVLLFVPWYYLMELIKGRCIQYKDFVRRTYYWLYGLWAGIIFANIAVGIYSAALTHQLPIWMGGTTTEVYDTLALWQLFDDIIIPTLIGVPTLAISLIFLLRKFYAESEEATHIETRELFQPVYFLPYLFAFATIVVSPVLTYLNTFVYAIWITIVAIVLFLFSSF